MKKTLILTICAVVLGAFFILPSSARDKEVYTVVGSDGEYSLSVYEGQAPTHIASGALGEILSLVPTDSEIVFSSVNTDESLNLPCGDFVLKGSISFLRGASLFISEGTNVTLDGFTAVFSESERGQIRIKGGSLTLENSSVFGGQSGAVLLDYSSESSLSLLSGLISSVSEGATVQIQDGSFRASGGRVFNTTGSAVKCDASFFLLGTILDGAVYDIETTRPLTLSHGEEYYKGGSECSVRFLDTFPEGEMRIVFYGARESSLERITLYDSQGKEQTVSCFEESTHTEEKNFGAVYKPYTVKFYDGSEIKRSYYLKGETVKEPDSPKREGYEFSGWYLDRTGGERYSFGGSAAGELSLFARYLLLPPSFEISSLDTVYDKSQRTHTFTELNHPLYKSGGFFGFEWYKDGTLVSRSRELCYENVSDSGVYECKITFSYGSDTVSVVAEGIRLNIERLAISPPEIPPVEYTGNPHTSPSFPSSIYTFESVVATDAGEYPVYFTLTDKENYKWLDSESETVSSDFLILPADNLWQEPLTIGECYLGNSPTPHATPLFGQVHFLYCETENGEYTQKMPTLVGKYYVIAKVSGTSNYKELVSMPKEFSVILDEVASLFVVSNPTLLEYRVFEKLVGAGLTVKATYKSGKEEIIGIDKVSVGYQSADSFRFGDNAVIISYGEKSVSLSVTVLRAEYDLSEVAFENRTLVYDGKYHTANLIANDIVGKDGIPLILTVKGGGSEVGEYSVYLTFSTESQNYNIPDTIEASLKITPLAVELIWENTVFTYDSNHKTPTAYYTDAFGVVRYATVIRGATDAGKYTAEAIPQNENHSFINATADFEILRADYDFSGIRWDGQNFLYDGQRHSVTLVGLPNGVTVIGYTDGSAVGAGTYTARATLSYDTVNYNPPPPISHEWCIMQAEYDTDGFSFSGSEAVFDGLLHYPLLEGEMPVGIDGISLSYSFSSGAMHVADSQMPIRIIFHTESKNYRPPEDITLYVTILPKGITVEWQGGEFVYNGKEQAPKATSEYTGINVTGVGKNAGEYIAKAIPICEDYYVINSEYRYQIEKAENIWVETPKVSDVYESGKISPSATPLSGEAVFRFYLDEACSNECEFPRSAGVYYMRAEVSEGGNYLALSYEPIAFTIIAVIPTGLVAELSNKSFRAFEKIGEEVLTVYLTKNDGSRERLLISNAVIEYQRADSFRRGDSAVTVSANGFSVSLAVSVDYADYDLSGVRWENTEAVYDGQAKAPVLTGIPDGITVLEYVGDRALFAGEYIFSVRLSYDSENYNEPKISPTKLVVKKQEIEIPEISAITYNGESQTPDLQSELYRIKDFAGATSAGSYSLTLAVSDSDNYCFKGGESEAELTLSVLPIEVSLKISPLTVYLWQSVRNTDFSVEGNPFLPKDTPMLRQVVSGGKIYIVSDDPNYIVVSEPGELIIKNYPAPWVLIFIFLVLAIIAVFILIYKKRKCRRLPPPQAYEPYEDDLYENLDEYRCQKEEESEEKEPQEYDEKDSECDNEEGEGAKDENGSSDEREVRELKKEDENERTDIGNSDISSGLSMDHEHADELITDSLAKNLLRRRGEEIRTHGTQREIINVDTLSQNFSAGDRVDVNILKSKNLVPCDTAYIKVLARGAIDKPLSVYANDFSLSAVKMIALTGGEAIKVTTQKEKTKKY